MLTPGAARGDHNPREAPNTGGAIYAQLAGFCLTHIIRVRFIAVEFLVEYGVFRFEKIYATRNLDASRNSFETYPYHKRY